MKIRNVYGLGLLLAFSACEIPRCHAQVENTPFGQVAKTQLNMIAFTPSWQPYIGPGSVIYVRWQPRMGQPKLGFVFDGKISRIRPTISPR